MTKKSLFEGISLLIQKDNEERTKRNLLNKTGTCEYECPYCGGTVFSCYFEEDRMEYGDLADYIHGGFICTGCRRSLRG